MRTWKRCYQKSDRGRSRRSFWEGKWEREKGIVSPDVMWRRNREAVAVLHDSIMSQSENWKPVLSLSQWCCWQIDRRVRETQLQDRDHNCSSIPRLEHFCSFAPERHRYLLNLTPVIINSSASRSHCSWSFFLLLFFFFSPWHSGPEFVVLSSSPDLISWLWIKY